MGWFSRTRTPKDDWSAMSSVTRVEAKLQELGEITPARRAGLIYTDSAEITFLSNIETELKTVLHEGEGATKTAFSIKDDDRDGSSWKTGTSMTLFLACIRLAMLSTPIKEEIIF